MTDPGADPINQLTTSPIPERLWHYTDIEGFRGIASSRKMRATDIRFLNDKEEFKHAVVLAKRLLLQMLSLDATPREQQLALEIYESLVERGSLSPGILKLFTASFTTNGDQLSQWRGYSRGSAGMSLGFDLRNVRELTKPLGAVFAPCVYKDHEKERLLRFAMTSFVNSVFAAVRGTENSPTVQPGSEELTKLPRQSDPDTRARWNQIKVDTGVKLVHLIGLLKHSSFEEEHEWRVFFPYFTNVTKPPQLQFRSRPSTLVPFIEFPLAQATEYVGLFRLKEIILGPGSEGETGADAARAFLSSLGNDDIAIRESRIPYRSW